MKTEQISTFTDRVTKLRFCGAMAFTVDEKTFALFERKGHFILLPDTVVGRLRKGFLDPLYVRKLHSRGFLSSEIISSSTNISKNMSKALPEFFMVDLTKCCNMHCRYCLRDINTMEKSISQERIGDICRFIVDYCDTYHLSDISVQAWGGEPLLELESLLHMREQIRPQRTRVHFSVETNALLLTPDVLKKLYSYRIGIGISIDGDHRSHDSQRVLPGGGGTHAIVERNLLAARRLYGRRIGTITTVTKNNAPYIEEILEYFATKLHLENVKFNFVHQSSFNDCHYLCLTKAEIADVELRILRKLVELLERGYPIFDNNLRIKLNNILYRKYSDICHSRGCKGGLKMVVIGMDGGIYPCELTDTPREQIGSIYEDSDLPRQIEQSKQGRDFYLKKSGVECKECAWYIFCGGGCTVRTINSGKRPPAIDEIECAVNSALYPALIELVLKKPEIVECILCKDCTLHCACSNVT